MDLVSIHLTFFMRDRHLIVLKNPHYCPFLKYLNELSWVSFPITIHLFTLKSHNRVLLDD